MGRIPLFLLTAPLLVAWMSGCVVQPPTVAGDDCETYPTSGDLLAKYEGTANESRENYDAVGVGVSSWGMAKHERRNQTPDIYLEWEKYPRENRPGIFQDVLCAAQGNIERVGPPQWHGDVGLKGGRGATVVTSQSSAEAAMAHLSVELERQNSNHNDDCCYILFAGYYYGAGWNAIHPIWADEH